MAESSLSFLGLGVQPPTPSWGSMIADGRDLYQLRHSPWTSVFPGLAIGAAGLISWGMSERVKDRVNVGVAAFALTVVGFYFSNVMDRLGRSASLVGLGLLLIAGGWGMERMRRRLVARLAAPAEEGAK